ncbi:MAG: hypothetical protein Kow0063_11000 [Anaerolineae bacterium]
MSRSTAEVARLVSEEIWGKGNLALVDEYYAQDYVDRNPVPGFPPTRDGLKAQIQMFRSAFPDMRSTTDEIIEAGDRVVVRYTVSGTHKGELMGAPPTGKSAQISGISIMRIADGQVVEEFSLADMMSLFQQLGLAG